MATFFIEQLQVALQSRAEQRKKGRKKNETTAADFLHLYSVVENDIVARSNTLCANILRFFLNNFDVKSELCSVFPFVAVRE